MKQSLLLPDPRPLVEKLGEAFFREAPERPGVYLMRDAAEVVVYVGKALNLRKRLGSYRVANPQRMARRHLRMVRAVHRIELVECADERSALAKEAELLLSLKPRFNRAGVWRGPDRFLVWRMGVGGVEMGVVEERQKVESGEQKLEGEDWRWAGPYGAGVFAVHAALARMVWCAAQPERGLAGMPEGWLRGRRKNASHIPTGTDGDLELERVLRLFFEGRAEGFLEWVQTRTAKQVHAFDVAVREMDFETLAKVKMRGQSGTAGISEKGGTSAS